jgi:glycosyltransferase involved in cell wall biosynthesis
MRKKVLVDCKIPWLYPRAGIAGFFNPLLEGVLDRHPELDFILVAPGVVSPPQPARANCVVRSSGYRGALSRLQYLRYSLIEFPRLLAQSGADLLLSPYYDFAIPADYRGRVLLTVHDLCFLDLPERYPFYTKWLHSWFLRRNLPRADGIVTVSEFSRNRILEHFPFLTASQSPQVIYNSLPPAPDLGGELDTEALRLRLGLRPEGRVVLYTGGIDTRKNLGGLLSGFAELRRSLNAVLVVTGNAAARSFASQISQAGVAGAVRCTGVIEEAAMRLLYREVADCGISVSWYEGGGRSALEARAHNLPFVSSRLEPVREMVGDYPFYCDASSPRDIADKLLQALHSPRIPSIPFVDERLSLSRNIARLSGMITAGVA